MFWTTNLTLNAPSDSLHQLHRWHRICNNHLAIPGAGDQGANDGARLVPHCRFERSQSSTGFDPFQLNLMVVFVAMLGPVWQSDGLVDADPDVARARPVDALESYFSVSQILVFNVSVSLENCGSLALVSIVFDKFNHVRHILNPKWRSDKISN